MRGAAFSSVAANNVSVMCSPAAAAAFSTEDQQLPPHHLRCMSVCVCVCVWGGVAGEKGFLLCTVARFLSEEATLDLQRLSYDLSWCFTLMEDTLLFRFDTFHVKKKRWEITVQLLRGKQTTLRSDNRRI